MAVNGLLLVVLNLEVAARESFSLVAITHIAFTKVDGWTIRTTIINPYTLARNSSEDNLALQLNDIDVRGCIYFLVHCFIYFIWFLIIDVSVVPVLLFYDKLLASLNVDARCEVVAVDTLTLEVVYRSVALHYLAVYALD